MDVERCNKAVDGGGEKINELRYRSFLQIVVNVNLGLVSDLDLSLAEKIDKVYADDRSCKSELVGLCSSFLNPGVCHDLTYRSLQVRDIRLFLVQLGDA